MNPWPPTRTRFKPGQSSNPGGRPKGISLAMRRAAKYAPKMIEVLKNIAEDENQPVMARIAAGAIVLDRGMGKPQPAPEVTDGEPHEVMGRRLTDEEREALVACVNQLPETEKDST